MVENINDRVKNIRKTHNMTQEDFAKRLGLSRSAVSNMESGRYGITDSLIKLICKELNVNEDWLRTGAGGPDNMWLQQDTSLLMKMGKLADSDNRFKKFCIETLIDAPDDFFDYIYQEFLKFDQNEKKEKE